MVYVSRKGVKAATRRFALGYVPRPQFVGFHRRKERWACIVAHRRSGKTVAGIMDLMGAALRSKKPDARFTYLSPTFGQGKDNCWAYLKQFTYSVPGVEQRESDLMGLYSHIAPGYRCMVPTTSSACGARTLMG